MALARDLFQAATRAKINGKIEQHRQIAAIYSNHSSGKYDATPDESEDWAESEEGRLAMARLVGEPEAKTKDMD